MYFNGVSLYRVKQLISKVISLATLMSHDPVAMPLVRHPPTSQLLNGLTDQAIGNCVTKYLAQ